MIEGIEVGSPDTIWGVAAVVVVQVTWMAQQWMAQRRGTRRSKSIRAEVDTVRSDVEDVKHHVVNDHGERNLRADIDKVLEFCEEFKDGLAELRGEMRAVTHRVDVITTVSTPHIVRPNPNRQGW